MKIVFATNNAHKLDEIRQIVGHKMEVLSLNDIGCHDDIPETGTTLEENARQKARYVWDHYHISVFADDTGLEVDALGGQPGIYSARYAAIEAGNDQLSHDSQANMRRLLRELANNNNRHARFRTVIALLLKKEDREDAAAGGPECSEGSGGSECRLFEGIVEGTITLEPSGVGGFGYDPIFRPEGYDKTFGELPAELKNTISHRARATRCLADYLLK